MSKCIICNNNLGEFIFENGKICSKCIGNFFTCPKCGTIYAKDDFENGDAGNGFCVKCSQNEH